ncbi:MAG: DUF5915 domain-containing protein, partial [Gemmatimonadales bacterium]
LQATVDAVDAAWASYDVMTGCKALMDFAVDDLSNWYVRVNRARFWAPDREADPAAVAALHSALVAVARLLAPAAPFTSDWLHRALTGGSVHLARLPSPGGARDEALEAAMDGVRRLASLARSARETVRLRVRQPLARMQVAIPAQVRGPAFDSLLELLRLEVNVKAVDVVASDADLVRLKAKPNFRSLGKRFGKRTPEIAALAARLVPGQLRELESGGTASLAVNGETIVYLSEDVAVEREVASDWVVQSEGVFVVALDPRLTPQLVQEGLARELVHQVQRLRKDADYAYSTRIDLAVSGPAEVLDAVAAYADFLQGETLARSLVVGGGLAGADREQSVALDGHTIMLAVRQHDAGESDAGPLRTGTG